MYEFIKAVIANGELRWEYGWKNDDGSVSSWEGLYYKDVSDLTENEIIDLVCEVLNAKDQRDIVAVEYR